MPVCLTCSSLLGLGEEHYASVRVHVATAVLMPAAAAPPTALALPAADAPLTWDPGVQVNLYGTVLLCNKHTSAFFSDFSIQNSSIDTWYNYTH